MCGIAGFAYMKKADECARKSIAKQSVTADYSMVDKHTRALKRMLVKMEKEGFGRSATGMFIVNRGAAYNTLMEPKIIVNKAAVTATQFVDPLEANSTIFNKINCSSINYVVGHVRAATHGLASDNRNNHPFVYETAVGVHNGGIDNYKEVFTKNNLKPYSQCDSEAIFALLQNKIKTDDEKSIKDAVINTCNELSGWLACVAVDSRFPSKLIVFRRSGPLTVLSSLEDRFFVFCSDEKIARTSLSEAGLIESKYVNMKMQDKEAVIFDTLENTGWASAEHFKVPEYMKKETSSSVGVIY